MSKPRTASQVNAQVTGSIEILPDLSNANIVVLKNIPQGKVNHYLEALFQAYPNKKCPIVLMNNDEQVYSPEGMKLIGHCSECKWWDSFLNMEDIKKVAPEDAKENDYVGVCRNKESEMCTFKIFNPNFGCIAWERREK